MNLIITSEHRVGSRWMHYLLADLYGMMASPEIDADKIIEKKKEVEAYFSNRRIVKFHHAVPGDIVEALPNRNYSIIGIVRNPMDRAVSLAFHNRYHN